MIVKSAFKYARKKVSEGWVVSAKDFPCSSDVIKILIFAFVAHMFCLAGQQRLYHDSLLKEFHYIELECGHRL